ncbi:MAG TPA: PLP-dependent aminotransferase family protein [Roseateles sp.]
MAQTLRRQIAAGEFVAGDRLPSIRSLAARHGLAKNTVIEAYDSLVASGEVEPRRGSGFYVRAVPASAAREDEPNLLDRAMDTVWILREQLNNDPAHLAIGHGIPPARWFDDARIERIRQRFARGAPDALFQYGHRFGHRPLRETLERRLHALGIVAPSNQILLTLGANEAMDLVVRGTMRPGDAALVDEPGYYPLYGKLALHGVKAVGVPRQADGPNVDAFEQLAATSGARTFFTQSIGHNPTGSDTSPAKAYRLLQIAERHGITIVENDAAGDLKPAGAMRLCTLDQLRRTVYIGSVTKTIGPALRVGFIAAEQGLVERLADLKMLIHVSNPEYAERVVDAVLGSPEHPRFLASLHEQVARETRHAVKILTGLGAELFCVPTHSLYLWARFPWAPDALALAKSLTKDQIALAPGVFFLIDGRSPTEWSRFNTGYVVDPRFAKAMLKYRPASVAKTIGPV